MSRKASTLKEDKPVNISISFNIAPNNEILKDKRSPADIRGRKIHNIETLKSNRDTPLHNYQFRHDDLTERQTFSRDEPRIDQFKKKRKMKRQSMDGIFDSKAQTDKLFISCENNKLFEYLLSPIRKPQAPLAKTSHMMSTRRKSAKSKIARPVYVPTSTKSENIKSGRIETSILKSVMGNRDKDKLSLGNLKQLISKLVADELKRQQDSQRTKPINLTKPPIKSQRRLKVQRKKSNEISKRNEGRKRPTSKQTMRQDVDMLKLNSLKLINDSSLIKSESDKQVSQNVTAPHLNHLIQAAMAIKTSTSQANLRDMVRVKYPEQHVVREYSTVEQVMALKIQRFWRDYRTKKIVKLYINILRDSEQAGYQYMYPDNHRESDLLTAEHEVHHPHIGGYLDGQAEDISELIDEFTEAREDVALERMPEPQQSDSKHIRQFHSYQLGRQQGTTHASDFKKKEISKWEETLEFIAKNMNNSDVRGILLQVAQQLENNKSSLQKQLSGEKKSSPQRRETVLFTLPLNTKKDVNDSFEDLEKQINELAQSYVSEQPNQELNEINFKSLHTALNNRKKALRIKETKELQTLENRLQAGKVTNQIYERQKQRLSRWIKYEETEIKKTKQHLDRGLSKARNIIEKNHGDLEFFQKLTDGSIKRCLSDSSFRRSKSKPKQIQRLQMDYGQEQDQEQQEEHSLKRTSEELSAKRLKQKLKNLNTLNDKVSPDASYESLSHEYNENEEESITNQDIDDEAAIINNELKLISQEQSDENRYEGLEESDREDIFEFIFLDLCIQFCQQVVEDSRTCIVSEYFIKAKKPPVRRLKGIKTNITIVKEYLKRFLSFLSRTNSKVMDRVGTPMGPSALEMLKYMHYNEDDAEDQEEDLVGTLVLPTNTFESFENTLLAGIEFEPYYDDPKRESDRIEFLKGVIHIHNKAIFDSLNESLDLQRPFGIWGKPFPWKRVPEFSRTLTPEQLQAKFKQSNDRVVQNCTYVCGIIIDKEDSLVAAGTRLSEDYIEQIKEDRLSRMLASDLIQNEERWVFYDDEETEVLVEISHLIYELILKDGCKEILSLKRA